MDKPETRTYEAEDAAEDAAESGASDNTRTVTKTEYVRMILAEKVRIVLTQTGYDENTALSILQSNGWDCSDAIKRYMNEGKKSAPAANDGDSDKPKPKSVNQKIYTEIRKLMDEASMSYYREKERKEELQRYVERLRKEHEQGTKEEQATKMGDGSENDASLTEL